MEFQLEFSMDNSSFEVCPEAEVNATLRLIGHRVLSGETSGYIRDSNGNKIGRWRMRIQT